MHILMLVLEVGLGPGMWLWSLVTFVPTICLGLEIGFKGLVKVFHETRLSHKCYFISSLAKLFSDPLLLRLEFST